MAYGILVGALSIRFEMPILIVSQIEKDELNSENTLEALGRQVAKLVINPFFLLKAFKEAPQHAKRCFGY